MKKGESYKLGQHILYCGDSVKDDTAIQKLLGKNKIRMVLTDPPYGIAYVESKRDFGNIKINKDKAITNDQLQTPDEYAEFTRNWLEAVTGKLGKYNTIFIFNCDLMYCALRKGMEMAGVYYSQQLIWIKSSVVMGRKDYLPQHEVIAYGWYGRHKMERGKGKAVMFHPKPAKSRLHPTMKPVGLLRKIILNSTKIGEWVYDPFGGSGSTLMACEHTKRKCLMVEMDVEYCNTIIERWQILTKSKAEKM